MEDVLALYEKPSNRQEPVVCLDEKPVTLHAEVRPPRPGRPGVLAKRDNEYERRGAANVFCAVEPKAGRRFTYPTPARRGAEFAQVIGQLSSGAHDSLGCGQSEHSLPEALGEALRRTARDPVVETVHVALHAETRQLAQPGRDRNQPLLAPMPGRASHPGPAHPPRGSQSLDPPYQPRPGPYQLAVHPSGRPLGVPLSNEPVYAVGVLNIAS